MKRELNVRYRAFLGAHGFADPCIEGGRFSGVPYMVWIEEKINEFHGGERLEFISEADHRRFNVWLTNRYLKPKALP